MLMKSILEDFILGYWYQHKRKEHYHFEIRGVEWHNCFETADSLIPVQLWNAQSGKHFPLPFLQTRHMPLVCFVFMIREIREWEWRREATSLCRWTEYNQDTPRHLVQYLTEESQFKCRNSPELQPLKGKINVRLYVHQLSTHMGRYLTLLCLNTASFYLDHCVRLAQELTELPRLSWQSYRFLSVAHMKCYSLIIIIAVITNPFLHICKWNGVMILTYYGKSHKRYTFATGCLGLKKCQAGFARYTSRQHSPFLWFLAWLVFVMVSFKVDAIFPATPFKCNIALKLGRTLVRQNPCTDSQVETEVKSHQE